jgi:hypothetical protein
MKLRQFTAAGIEAFENYLASARNNPASVPPRDLLESPAVTTQVSPAIEVAAINFVARADAAIYLGKTLEALPEEDVRNNAGLWTWLSLFYFDQVCPPSNGKYTVKNSYYYVFEPHNPRHFYRHLLFVGWRVIQIAPDHSRLYLNVPLSTLDTFTTEVLKRLYLTRIPCIFEVLDRLYWDPRRKRPVKGVVGTSTTRPGDLVHRLPIRIRQLEKTYDLQSLTAEQLLNLLGKEFVFRR